MYQLHILAWLHIITGQDGKQNLAWRKISQ